ncbi:hypothetical protein [Tepidanaerobacter syntrophicus]|uniref:hypothetical protein n=1 Tax=Tepidanaerobacter syntrophicus TaxID=224999 RepID=UPI001BD43052|nr:hypothetical protein [Tepidanaerobacter syntrophicus]
MQVATVRATFDRKTMEKIGEEVIDYQEMDEDEYYRPIVEILWPRFMEWLKQQQEEVKNDVQDNGD